MDGSGNVYITDPGNYRVRRVAPNGIITTFVGNGGQGSSGDGGLAINAQLYDPTALAIDASGNLYIADSSASSIRQVSPAGIITTFSRITGGLGLPHGLAADAWGYLYYAFGFIDNEVFKISPGGVLVTRLAGGAPSGYSGDGGPAVSAKLNQPLGVAVDTSGNIYVADAANNAIRLLTPLPTASPAILTTSPLPQGTVGTAYSQTLSATGGARPYTWLVISGVLPSGLTFSNGTISGTPTAAGSYSFTVELTDGAATSASGVFAITVLQVPVCTFVLSSSGEAFPAAGGAGSVAVTAPSGCSWTTSSSLSWVTKVTPSSGTGTATVSFQVASNAGTTRSGSITVAGISFTVEEARASLAGFTAAGSLAQVPSGGGWQATITLINSGNTAEEALVSFYDDYGNPLALPVNYPQTPLATPELAYSIDRTVLPGSEILIQTAGPNNQTTVAGWALVQASGSLTGSSLFDWGISGNQQEAVAQLENRTPNSFLLSFDQTGGYVLGIAVANASSIAANVPAILRDDTGATIATSTIALPALGHTAFMLSDKFAAAVQKRGTLEFQVPAGNQISTIGFRANSQGSLATVLPLTK